MSFRRSTAASGFSTTEAKHKILKGQVALIEQLESLLELRQ
ncbi:MAG: hypothetical protein ACT443_05140 [Gemmatimonadota bacterium]